MGRQEVKRKYAVGGGGGILAEVLLLKCTDMAPPYPVSQVGKPYPRWVWRDHALAVTDLHVGMGASAARYR